MTSAVTLGPANFSNDACRDIPQPRPMSFIQTLTYSQTCLSAGQPADHLHVLHGAAVARPALLPAPPPRLRDQHHPVPAPLLHAGPPRPLVVQDEVGLRLQTAITAAIYRKSLRLSSGSRQAMTVGDATNLIAIDCQRFIDVTFFLNHIWASPLLIILCLANLWSVLGPSTLAGDPSALHLRLRPPPAARPHPVGHHQQVQGRPGHPHAGQRPQDQTGG